MVAAAPKIVRIIAVRDTRDRIEVGDRWVPVPGSGQARPCDRCGRDHEIHVDVELSDGTTSTIGQGCARGESMEIQGRIKSAISAAKTRAKLAAELAVARGEHMRAATAWREVEKLSPPVPVVVEEEIDKYGRVRRVYAVGDAHVASFGTSDFDRKGAVDSARRGWQMNRYYERGFRRMPYDFANTVADLEKRLKTIERKLETFTR